VLSRYAQGQLYLFISNKDDGATDFRMDIEQMSVDYVGHLYRQKIIGKKLFGFLTSLWVKILLAGKNTLRQSLAYLLT